MHLLYLLACSSPDSPDALEPPVDLPVVALATNAYDAAPLAPAVFRDVARIDDTPAFTDPYVPGHRTTMDGRVGVRVQGGTDEVPRLNEHLSFFLFAPERLTAPLMTGPAGPELLADPTPFDVPFPPALDPAIYRLGHHAICDPTTPFPTPGERPNPYVCGPDDAHDCYDLTIVSTTSITLGAQLWGTPVTVEVSQPKTAQARIVDVALGEPVAGHYLPLSPEWTEPSITIDGRLMTGRMGRVPRDWSHPETGDVFTRPYDLAYSLLPDDAAPCDVTGWTDFHPMSHAPYDPRMVGRYGLASYPFRDTEGNLIPDGEDMGGTYPWVDREGANLFMTGVHGRLSEQSESDYPRRCVHEGCDDINEPIDFDRGFMVAGAWTHGKLVHLDAAINHIDWAVGVHPDSHWLVDLYRDEAGQPVPVRVGAGRFLSEFRDVGATYPDGYTHNANVLDSPQHLLNAHELAKPITPRDVVWVMSSGVATAEVAFDDLLDPHALVVANMQASITQLYDDDGQSTGIPDHHNGQVRELGGGLGLLATYELVPGATRDIHLQNGATSLVWEVPPYGVVDAGTGRVEPVALGGVEGRGFWLTGSNRITFAMPDQPAANEVDGYVGLFVDARAGAGEARELLTFPDGTSLVLAAEAVAYVREGEVHHEASLPTSDGWRHLAWRLTDGHRSVQLLVDGLAYDEVSFDQPWLSFSGGELVVGRTTEQPTGVRGWIDQLLVLAHDPGPEVACNHAGGTLLAVDDAPDLVDRATAWPAWAHEAVAQAAGLPGSAVLCHTDLSTDHGIDVHRPPTGAVPLREALTFPEGPLRAGSPRPDSSDNGFCLSCHTADGRDGLGLDALAYDDGLTVEHDPRRQPNQPPRRVFGHIPAHWLPGSPAEAQVAPPEGFLIDPWVLGD